MVLRRIQEEDESFEEEDIFHWTEVTTGLEKEASQIVSRVAKAQMLRQRPDGSFHLGDSDRLRTQRTVYLFYVLYLKLLYQEVSLDTFKITKLCIVSDQ